MRVLFNAMQAGNQSGTGRYVEELIPHLLALENPPELTVWWPERAPAPSWADRVDLVPQRRGLWNRLALERAAQRARDRFDIVHYPASIGPLDGGDNVVLTVHDCIFMRHPEWFRWERARYYRWAGLRSARRAGRIIADSEATAGDVAAYMGIPRDRIDVVPLAASDRFRPAPVEEIAAARARHGLPERFVLYTGTLEPRKNLAALVRAWDAAAKDIPDALVIAGRAGWKTSGLHEAIRAARHRERILLTGFIPDADLPALLSGARAFVWPSRYEGFGLPVLEAMACGAPVITADCSSLPEVAGDAAVLVDPNDEAALSRAIRAICLDDEARARLSVSGLRRASEFTWRRCAEQTCATYARVIQSR
ncbi:MAG: glycosyltransferase family 4 protein [Candidatus Hydrogenedentes bacterium]|nr:glycosyltransferase family 4 protein [Candidatus Hydrogenedentota bacterium]